MNCIRCFKPSGYSDVLFTWYHWQFHFQESLTFHLSFNFSHLFSFSFKVPYSPVHKCSWQQILNFFPLVLLTFSEPSHPLAHTEWIQSPIYISSWDFTPITPATHHASPPECPIDMWLVHWGLLLSQPWRTWVCRCEVQVWRWCSCLGRRGSGSTRYSGALAARAAGNIVL